MDELGNVSFDVEDYIACAPSRSPRFTEADLRSVAERAHRAGAASNPVVAPLLQALTSLGDRHQGTYACVSDEVWNQNQFCAECHDRWPCPDRQMVDEALRAAGLRAG